MTKAKVYGSAKSFRTQKVLVAAKIAKKDVDVVETAPPAQHFPLGVTPALEDGKTYLVGDNAIAKYLLHGNAQLVPQNPELDQWLFWSAQHLLPNVLSYVLPSVSAASVDANVVAHAKEELLEQLKHFDKILLTKTFLVGEQLTIADIIVALDLLLAFQHVLDASVRSDFAHVTRWFQTVVHQTAVKEVLGQVQLADKISTFNAEDFKKLSASASKKSAPKKEEKKADKKASKPDEDEADAALAAEPKFVDPFAAMPPGKLNMDAWKRCYSNEDTATKAIPWFWENFDAENYSIWHCEYKFPEELSLVFMSCNLITGMFQRLDKMRKYAFGSVCLFGSDNNSTISGVWVWRGHDLAFELSPDLQVDYESYAWKKLDPTSAETKKTVNEFLLWEGDFGGKKFNQGKIFK